MHFLRSAGFDEQLQHKFSPTVCLFLQSALCITCMRCPTTREMLWEAITRPTAKTRRWGSGTATMTPGIILSPDISGYQIGRKLCSLITLYLHQLLNENDLILGYIKVFQLLTNKMCVFCRVSPVSSSQVRSSNAYVLFYELAPSSHIKYQTCRL